jgi:hypothetical protein
MNNCATCDHKRYPDGGHCYMFRHAPEWECQQHTARRPFTMSLFEVARMVAEVSEAQVRDQDSLFGCLPEEKKP